MKPTLKDLVSAEILALLDDSINTEIAMMGNHYTVAEIAREVLLKAGEPEPAKHGLETML
jgi:hypothetical protein